MSEVLYTIDSTSHLCGKNVSNGSLRKTGELKTKTIIYACENYHYQFYQGECDDCDLPTVEIDVVEVMTYFKCSYCKTAGLMIAQYKGNR